jgi:hypothetical protein
LLDLIEAGWLPPNTIRCRDRVPRGLSGFDLERAYRATQQRSLLSERLRRRAPGSTSAARILMFFS